ncbi:MAG: histidine kinase dimerization/phospho-acceptor domain-containing protein [Cryomorphaceae bacterium]
MSTQTDHTLDPNDIYQNALCGLLSTNSHGDITQVNSTLLKWLGHEKDQVVGKLSFRDLLSVGAKIYFETHLMPLMKLQGGFTEVQVEMKGLKGRKIPVLLSAIGVDGGNPDSSHYHFTIVDITQRKLYEKELLKARKDAESKTERLREINTDLERFAHTASHDLQAPLRTIVGMLSLVRKKGLVTEESKKYFDLIDKNARRMRMMVLDLLDYSRIDSETDKLKAVDLNDVCRQAIEALGETVEESGAEFQVDQLPEVTGSEIQLSRLFQNLFSNALKYRSEQKPMIRVESKVDGDFLRHSCKR